MACTQSGRILILSVNCTTLQEGECYNIIVTIIINHHKDENDNNDSVTFSKNHAERIPLLS